MPRRDGIRIRESGLDEMITAVERLASSDPNERLDAAHAVVFAEMKSAIPVKTGLMKSTAYATADSNEGEWIGSISVGDGLAYTSFVYPAGQPNELDAIFNESEALYRAALDNWWSDTD